MRDLVLEKLEEVLRRLSRIEQSTNSQKHEEWLRKEQAMQLLDCAKTKLRELVMSGYVLVNSNPGKGKQLKYSRKSINKYLNGNV